MAASETAASDAVRSRITGVVLAGGRGTRMGGVDKGLQLFDGQPLALHALHKLERQVGRVMLNANRHLDQYRLFGAAVWPDEVPDHAGPLAGIITALRHCDSEYLATVPCDAPLFPDDLVQQLSKAMESGGHEIAMACTPQADPTAGSNAQQAQPVFCLLRANLLADLERYVASGGRRVEAWTAQNDTVMVPFDSAAAFSNINTMAELRAFTPALPPAFQP